MKTYITNEREWSYIVKFLVLILDYIFIHVKSK